MISLRKLVRGRLSRVIVTLAHRTGNAMSHIIRPDEAANTGKKGVARNRMTITVERERVLVVRASRRLNENKE